jgi:hypothetical protein
MLGAACSVCAVELGTGGYAFNVGSTERLACRRHALTDRPTVKRAIQIAVVVGTALSLINELDLLLVAGLSPLLLAKIGLNYCVPFGVSLYSALAVSRRGPATPRTGSGLEPDDPVGNLQERRTDDVRGGSQRVEDHPRAGDEGGRGARAQRSGDIPGVSCDQPDLGDPGRPARAPPSGRASVSLTSNTQIRFIRVPPGDRFPSRISMPAWTGSTSIMARARCPTSLRPPGRPCFAGRAPPPAAARPGSARASPA